jgi:cell division septation protein DedD
MTDPGVREIQLSSKQLVFLFMAAVVFSVAVFLLGVSVGRGVRSTELASAATPPASATVPPATKVAPGDLSYNEALQKPRPGDGAKPVDPPAPQPVAPPIAGAQSPPPAPPPPDASQKSPPPPASEVKPAPSSGTPTPPPPAAPGTGRFFVQVGSFRERSLADKLVQDLKREGYAATLVRMSGSLPNKVRVGPYARESEAQDVLKRLSRYKPMIVR